MRLNVMGFLPIAYWAIVITIVILAPFQVSNILINVCKWLGVSASEHITKSISAGLMCGFFIVCLRFYNHLWIWLGKKW